MSINALAETVNGLYKTELVYGPARSGPWKTIEDLELGTPGLGELAQHQPPAQLPRRPAAGRVRSRVLRCPTDRPAPDRNPIARASIRTRAVQEEGSACPTSRPEPRGTTRSSNRSTIGYARSASTATTGPTCSKPMSASPTSSTSTTPPTATEPWAPSPRNHLRTVVASLTGNMSW